MADGTYEEYQFLHGLERQYIAALPERILDGLRQLDDGLAGYQVTRLEHSLQSATRAEADGADIEWVVAALVHDIGDGLAPENHSQMAAAILRPYVREEVTWVVHDARAVPAAVLRPAPRAGPRCPGRVPRATSGSRACQRFCERWDQAAFDPDYATQPLEHFEPMVRRVFSRPAFATSLADDLHRRAVLTLHGRVQSHRRGVDAELPPQPGGDGVLDDGERRVDVDWPAGCSRPGRVA